MANYLDKARIPVGANEKHKFPLHRGHITTGNFMRFDVSMARELAADSTYNGNHQTFIRTLPFKKPLLSSLHVHNTAFFVPFRTVWEPFSDFIEDTPHNQPAGTGIISNTPLLTNDEVWKLFTQSAYSSVVANPDLVNATNYDFNTSEGQGGFKAYKFTEFGCWAYSLLVQLGYKFSPVLYGSASSDYSRSCLPLLCAAKVYIDWYFPNAYAHYGVYATIDGIMQRQVTYSLTRNELDTILTAIYKVAYNSDYFVNAFDNPSGPNSGVGSINFSIPDITNFGSGQLAVENSYTSNPNGSANGTPSVDMAGASGNAGQLTQYNIMTLHRLTDYCRRHQLAGSRALERYLADWGVALSADKLKRSIKLREEKFPFQVGEVMADADTYQVDGNGNATGAQLGDYAGRAVAFNGNLDFEFHTDEFGYLFVVSTIIPDVGYTQGEDRMVMHKTKLDFLSSFDGCGVQEIRIQELFSGLMRPITQDSIFGFTGRCAEYKITKDVLSGAFLFNSKKQGLLGWETMRLFADLPGMSDFNITHSLDFMLGNDSSQYNRIFIDDESEDDGFVLVHRDNFELIQPALPLFDIFDFEDANKKRIELQSNGIKVN